MLTLYSSAVDPRSHWVRLVAAEKALELRLVETDPRRPPEDLIDLNPYQSVPTLVDRDLVVYEPQVICEYLDERFPHPTMLPNDPAGRAQARLAMLRIAEEWYLPAAELEAASERRDHARARRLLRESVISAEPLFRQRQYFLADQFSVIDAAIAPILWRLPALGIELPEEAPQLQRYAARVFARAGFRSSLSEPERRMRE